MLTVAELTVLVHASLEALGKSTRSALVAMSLVDWAAAAGTARFARVLTTLAYRALHTQSLSSLVYHTVVTRHHHCIQKMDKLT